MSDSPLTNPETVPSRVAGSSLTIDDASVSVAELVTAAALSRLGEPVQASNTGVTV